MIYGKDNVSNSLKTKFSKVFCFPGFSFINAPNLFRVIWPVAKDSKQ
uniref:Uncharacterized protein n=1 Tax=uncultured alpha proteobacterium HF0130_20P23 TaxID=710809 RepID=E0XTB8_9PROT|nr:hypothetical protein [uncultured alpha proteobacterium HF0130_20P23]